MAPSSDPRAASITGREFAVRRKGFDPDEVKAYLGQLAEAVGRLTTERDTARADVAELRTAAESRPVVDEEQLTAALGEETARVLTSAHKAAAEIRERAEESVARLLKEAAESAGQTRREAEADAARLRDEAQAIRTAADEARQATLADTEAEAARLRAEAETDARTTRDAAEAIRAEAELAATAIREDATAEATRVRAEAEEVLGVRTAAADEAGAAIVATAEAEAEGLRQTARDDAAAIRSAAGDDRDAAQAEGREMVAEAQRVRERMLADLSRRRKAARVQLEQLQAARDRLLESYEGVQRTMDEATAGLRRALPDARTAADAARMRADAEPEATVEQLEAQISAARAAGLPLVAPAEGDEDTDLVVEGEPTGPTPVIDLTGEAPEAEAEVESADTESAEGVDVTAEPVAVEPVVIDAPAVTDEAAPEPVAEVEESITEPEPAAAAVVEPEPEAAPEPEPEPEPERGAEAEPAPPAPTGEDLWGQPDAELDDEGTTPEPEPEPVVVAVAVDADVEAEADGAEEPEGVDELFAKLKASRADDEPTAETDVVAPEAAEVEVAADGIDDESLLNLLERRDGAVEPIEARVARRLKKVLADEQGSVLDAVRQEKGRADLDAILPVADQLAAYATAVADDLMAAAEEGAAFEGASLPPSTSVASLADELARGLAGVVRPRVEKCFDGVEDADDVSDRLRATYREWKTDRLVEATRHVVLAAFGQGQVAVRPAGALVRWVPDPTSPAACPDCEDDALAGAVPSGEAFPTGHAHPPAHPGCRCLVVGERVATPA
ncbi:MAG TPA: DivIVA domain-containing protein [Iamia sp.]|nr:DivIVA domain-containing protein [Iamia sp.]